MNAFLHQFTSAVPSAKHEALTVRQTERLRLVVECAVNFPDRLQLQSDRDCHVKLPLTLQQMKPDQKTKT